MYGAQTQSASSCEEFQFENDVEMYGAQTEKRLIKKRNGLRMM